MKWVSSIILTITFNLITFFCFAQSYSFKHFESETGLNQSYIYKISQGYKRQLILSTGDGLVFFNGSRFSTLTINNGLANNFCTTHQTDRQGNIWVGHFQNGISYIDTNLKIRKFLSKELESVKISKVNIYYTSNKDYKVFISTIGDGIYTITNKFKIEHYNNSSNTYNITLKEKSLLVADENGISELDINTLKTIATTDSIDGNDVTASCYFQNKVFLAIKGKGILKIDENNNSEYFLKFDNEETNVTDIFIDKMQSLNIAIFNEGVVQIPISNKYRKNVYNIENGLKTNLIQSIFEDDEYGLWVGSFGYGLFLLTSDRFTTKKNYKNVKAILKQQIGSRSYFWVGAADGLYCNENKYTNQTLDKLNPSITSFASNSDSLYIGTESHGLFLLNTTTKKLICLSDKFELPKEQINCIKKINNIIYLATISGIYILDIQKITYQRITTSEGLLHNNIYHIYIDNKNNIWCAAYGAGLFYYNIDTKKTLAYKNINGLKSYKINSIISDFDNNVWFTTEGDGIFKKNNYRFIQYTEKNNLLSNYCNSIVCDNYGTLWISHKNGLSSIKRGKDNFNTYQKKEGLSILNFNLNSAYKDNLGNLFWGSNEGITELLNKKRLLKLTANPGIVLDNIFINGKILSTKTNEINLPYGKYDIRIIYSAVHFSSVEKIRYRFMLKGFEQKINESNINSSYYPQLADGNYEFVVNAKSAEDIISNQSIKIKIKIDKPFYKKPYPYIIALIILFAIIQLFVKLRLRQLKKQTEYLRLLVNERTSELKIEKDKLSIVNNKLSVINKDLKDSITYAKQIQESIFPSIDLIKKHIPNIFIYYKPRDIVSGDFYYFKKIKNKIYFAVIDCTGHGVPGALMSMLCNTQLNKIVENKVQYNPKEIIEELNNNIVEELNQTQNNNQEGLDISLVIYNTTNNTLQLSAAARPIYIVRNNEMIEYKGSVHAVGGFTKDLEKEFPLYETTYETNDMVYMFSDGYVDQFNEDNNKKFLSRNLKKLLVNISDKSINEQHTTISNTFTNWKKGTQQTDDVLIVGIKL